MMSKKERFRSVALVPLEDMISGNQTSDLAEYKALIAKLFPDSRLEQPTPLTSQQPPVAQHQQRVSQQVTPTHLIPPRVAPSEPLFNIPYTESHTTERGEFLPTFSSGEETRSKGEIQEFNPKRTFPESDDEFDNDDSAPLITETKKRRILPSWMTSDTSSRKRKYETITPTGERYSKRLRGEPPLSGTGRLLRWIGLCSKPK